jgi:hypothetical protein
MNIDRLDEAIAYIEAHPERHNQRSWFRRRPCGTTACLAGTVAMLAGWTPIWRDHAASFVMKDDKAGYVAHVACELLDVGSDSDERFYLFMDADDLDDIKTFRDEYVAGIWVYPQEDD